MSTESSLITWGLVLAVVWAIPETRKILQMVYHETIKVIRKLQGHR